MQRTTSGLRPSKVGGWRHRRVTVSIMKKITITNITSNSRSCTSRPTVCPSSSRKYSRPRTTSPSNSTRFRYLYLLYLEKSLRRIEIGIPRHGPKPQEKGQEDCRGNRTQVLLQRRTMWQELRLRGLPSTAHQTETPRTLCRTPLIKRLSPLLFKFIESLINLLFFDLLTFLLNKIKPNKSCVIVLLFDLPAQVSVELFPGDFPFALAWNSRDDLLNGFVREIVFHGVGDLSQVAESQLLFSFNVAKVENLSSALLCFWMALIYLIKQIRFCWSSKSRIFKIQPILHPARGRSVPVRHKRWGSSSQTPESLRWLKYPARHIIVDCRSTGWTRQRSHRFTSKWRLDFLIRCPLQKLFVFISQRFIFCYLCSFAFLYIFCRY